jgi:hypothetical protein
MPAMVSPGMPGPLSSTTMRSGFPFLPVLIVILMIGATPDSSQASAALSTNSLMMTSSHLWVSWPVWATSSFSDANSTRREVVKATRSIVCAGSTGSFGRPDTMRRGVRPNRARATLTAPTLHPKAAAMTEALSPRSHISRSSSWRSTVQPTRDLTSANFVKISDPGRGFSPPLNRGPGGPATPVAASAGSHRASSCGVRRRDVAEGVFVC